MVLLLQGTVRVLLDGVVVHIFADYPVHSRKNLISIVNLSWFSWVFHGFPIHFPAASVEMLGTAVAVQGGRCSDGRWNAMALSYWGEVDAMHQPRGEEG